MPIRAHTRSQSRVGKASLVAVTMALIAGCGGGSDSGGGGDTVSPEAVSLKFFSGPAACTELASHVRESAVTMMLAQFEPIAANGTIEFDGAPVPVASPAPNAPPSSGAPANNTAGASPVPEAGSRFSETTLRTEGVDEADPVKHDGTRLYTLRRDPNQLVLTRASLRPAASMRVEASVAWPDNGAEALVHGLFLPDPSRLVVVSTGGGSYYPMPLPATSGFGTSGAATVASASPIATKTSPVCSASGCGDRAGSPPWVQLRLVDATSANLETTWSMRLAGRLIGARRIGDKLHVATQSELALPEGVSFQPVMTSGMNAADVDAAREALKASNSKLIREAPLSSWLAPLAATDTLLPTGTAPADPTPEQCASFARTGVATRLGWLRVNTIDLASRGLEQQTVLASASGLYMSARSLILSTPEWNRTRPYQAHTLLHRFSLDAQGRPRHDASGRFPGSLLNDYAIDERADGVIRIVAMQSDTAGTWTTIENLGRVPTDRPADPTTTGEPAARLTSLGRSEPIARGETLRSARFIGDRVYFVTFRTVDPFFVYDLSDPSRPLALGELKIPGFSTWLQPVGNNHLLGIGYDSGGWPRRIKASLFDVSDPRAPREQAVLSLGESYTSSEALWDPHAFTWLPAADAADGGTMAIPIRGHAYERYATRDESGIRVVAVAPRSTAAPLTVSGTLDMLDLRRPPEPVGTTPWYGWRETDPRRSVIVDDIVYGVSDRAIRAASLQSLATPVGTLLLP